MEDTSGRATWRVTSLDASDLPSPSKRSLPDPVTSECELCSLPPDPPPLASVLVVESAAGLPVPFLICDRCRRALDELHALLESAGASPLGA
jgi:hypothetical protein